MLVKRNVVFGCLNVCFVYFFCINTLFFAASCASTRSTIYFGNLADTVVQLNTPVPEPIIQPNDLLSIQISSLNQEASALFNAPNHMATSSTTVSGLQEAGGYLVDVQGFIQLPLLGKMHVAGKTKSVVRDSILTQLKDQQLLLDPVVTIRYLNFEVTIMGEVGKPAVINVPNERISLLKALGMAGDITVYGIKDHVTLIREQGGKRWVRHLNINAPAFINAQEYYLQPGDIIYVEPNRHKIYASKGIDQYLSITLSGLSFLAIILTQVFN